MSQSSSGPENATLPSAERSASLGLFDAICLIIGIVIGSTIFRAPTFIAGAVGSVNELLFVWALGGVLSLIGALCYAELAATYPRSGGDYHYLTKAFGSHMGFLFGWAQLSIVQTSSIGALAFIFADQTVETFRLSAGQGVWLAMGAVVFTTAVNMLGLAYGKTVQNLLTIGKLAGIAVLIVAGVAYGSADAVEAANNLPKQSAIGFAMILVLYAYGGWNDAAFVAGEIRRPERNVPLALGISLTLITAIYIMINLAYVGALGFAGLAASRAPASDTMTSLLGPNSGVAFGILVMVSSLGGLNGLVLAVSRVHAQVATEHRLFGWLRPRRAGGKPIASLLIQALLTFLLVLIVGTETGRISVDLVREKLFGSPPIPWDLYNGGFETLVAGSAPIFWLFLFLTGLSVMVLRQQDTGTKRLFQVPLYPISPMIFCGMCLFMLYSATVYAAPLLMISLVPLGLGIALMAISGYRPISPERE